MTTLIVPDGTQFGLTFFENESDSKECHILLDREHAACVTTSPYMFWVRGN